MQRVRDDIDRFARTREIVLISGETGTGKELVARELHARSGFTGEFIVLDCAALDPALFGSEIFGHVLGAFTGAIAKRDGAILAAKNGTLFVDEMHRLPEFLQAKLLRAFSDPGKYKQTGSDHEADVHCRIVCATNVDLESLVARDLFLPDLYQRIRGLPVNIPPLRERTSDIRLLLKAFALERGLSLSIDPDADERLAGGPWPGNVRELIQGAKVLAILDDGGFESTLHLTAQTVARIWPSTNVAPIDPLAEPLKAIEAALRRGPIPGLVKTLTHRLPELALKVGGTPDRAATLLGIPRDTFEKQQRRRRGK
jgi:DNA-binding NtrC family response regulator